MKLMSYKNIIQFSFNYLIHKCKISNIDESHSVKHGMDVFHTANLILNNEICNNPGLKDHKTIIGVSSILHDICDNKYFDTNIAINDINNSFKEFLKEEELNAISNIIKTMSYSTVKKNGFPNLGIYTSAYHIVREADLLTAYDPDRCIIYGIEKENLSYTSSLERSIDLLENRVLKYLEDDLFVNEYSKKKAIDLNNDCKEKIENLKSIKNFLQE
jgi:hypothetical protein